MFLVLLLCAIPLLKNPPARFQSSTATDLDDSLPLIDLLKNSALMLLAIAAFIVFIELYGVLTWVPAFLAESFHYSPAEIGTSATMFGIAAIPASVVCGYLCSSLKRVLWLSLSGGLIAGTGILLMIFIGKMPVWQTVCIITLITWGHTQIVVSIMSLASLIVPSHSTGKALGLIFTFGYAGSVIPTYLGGYLLERTGTYDLAFIVFAASAFFSVAAMLAVCRILYTNPPAHFNLRLN